MPLPADFADGSGQSEGMSSVPAKLRSGQGRAAGGRFLPMRHGSGDFAGGAAYVGGTCDKRKLGFRYGIFLRLRIGVCILPELCHFVRAERQSLFSARSGAGHV